MKEISRGAEAVIYLDDDSIVKERPKKNYRIKEIDNKLRTERTEREAKILEKISVAGIPGPQLLEKEEATIRMEYIEGERLRDALNKDNVEKLMKETGKIIADLHDREIIHGDLTTSNMMLKDNIYLIDFGLSFFSQKVEDKAVDIHLLREALEAKHHDIYKKALEAFKKGYKKSKTYEEVMERLKEVEGRGRYKGKS